MLKKIFLSALLSLMSFNVASAQFDVSFWEKPYGTSYIQPTDDLDVHVTNLTVSGIFTFGGTMAGDLDMNGNDILNLGQVLGGPGSAGAPTYSVVGEATTGFWGDGVGSAYITAGGINRVTVNSGGIISSAKIRTPDGTAAAPIYTFSNDVNTGVFRIGADSLGFSAGGQNRLTANSSGLTLHGNVITGPSEIVEDGGAINVLNMPVSSTPTAGDEESFTWQIDQVDHLIVYSEADGSGWLQNSSIRPEVRFEENQGTDVASVTYIALPEDGNAFELTGTTQVDLIDITGWRDGSKITLLCNESVTIGDAVATSGANTTILLAGSANFGCTAEDSLTLMLSSTTAGGQAWREISRSAN